MTIDQTNPAITGQNYHEHVASVVAKCKRIVLETQVEAQSTGRSKKRAANTIEPHPDHSKYALGAALYNLHLTYEDAFSVIGFLKLPTAKFRDLLTAVEMMKSDLSVGEAIVEIIDSHAEHLDCAGRAASKLGREERYLAKLRQWESQPECRKYGRWRERHMSTGQRQLIRETAIALKVPIPEGMNRGEAADWLKRNGANLSYLQEF